MHLFIAHHKDDNLETFLNRKIAGSDFYGLKSMSEFSLYNKVCIIRPLLNFSKETLLDYNKKNKIEYINDPSNFNLDYTRPTIRNFLKKSDQKTIKEINKDFENILFYSPYFIQMIFEILLKNIVKIDSKKIIVGLDNMKNLNEINKINDSNFLITFSYGRGLQASALKEFGKNQENTENIQKAFNHRAKMNGLSSKGEWSEELEKEFAA